MTEFEFRKDLVEDLGNEIGKSVYKQFTQNEKYMQHDLSYMELKQVIDSMYAKIYELMYKDRYGEPVATSLLEHKALNKNTEEDVSKK